MISRLENTDTGSSDLCFWVVWQNARLCFAPQALPEPWRGGKPGLLLLSQPFRRGWRLLICQPCLFALLSCLSPGKNHTPPW